MLEFASASFLDRRPAASIWRRSILLGLTAISVPPPRHQYFCERGGFRLGDTANKTVTAISTTAATPQAPLHPPRPFRKSSLHPRFGMRWSISSPFSLCSGIGCFRIPLIIKAYSSR
jgi:hypothetical protein